MRDAGPHNYYREIKRDISLCDKLVEISNKNRIKQIKVDDIKKITRSWGWASHDDRYISFRAYTSDDFFIQFTILPTRSSKIIFHGAYKMVKTEYKQERA